MPLSPRDRCTKAVAINALRLYDFLIENNVLKPGAEFKDADIATNDRFVERKGQIMYRMTCGFNDHDWRIGFDI